MKWIQNSQIWGGGIELAALARHFATGEVILLSYAFSVFCNLLFCDSMVVRIFVEKSVIFYHAFSNLVGHIWSFIGQSVSHNKNCDVYSKDETHDV